MKRIILLILLLLIVSCRDKSIQLPDRTYPLGLSLIFFADGYKSWQEFNQDIDVLLRQMKLVEPWKSYSDYNIYRIMPEETSICTIKIKDERRPVIRCNPKLVNKYLNKLRAGYLKLIVLSRQRFESWANVVKDRNSGIFLSLPYPLISRQEEQSGGIFFLHLLGHSFGLKDEEYFVLAKANSAAHKPDGPNCAPDIETAKQWWGDLAVKYPNEVGYFPECAGNKNYIKPTKGSLMNLGDLKYFELTYGLVSERYLQNILHSMKDGREK